MFRCAKRSILPNKAETSEKAVRSFYGQNSTAESHKMEYFLGTLFSIVCTQSGLKTFVAAVSSKRYKSMRENMRKKLEYYLFISCYESGIFLHEIIIFQQRILQQISGKRLKKRIGELSFVLLYRNCVF